MPKGLINMNNQKETKIDSIEFLPTTENTILNDSTISIEDEIKTKRININKFIYFTPIPKGKKDYIPGTPKKKKKSIKYKDLIIKGINLLDIFNAL